MARGVTQGLQAGTLSGLWLAGWRAAPVLALLALAACAQAPRPLVASRTAALMDLAPAAARLPPRANTPGELVGLSGAEVAGLLGAPSLTRHDDPAEVWQYADGGCVLLVFLYGPAGKVSHAETRGVGAGAQCFSRLRGRAPQAVPSPG